MDAGIGLRAVVGMQPGEEDAVIDRGTRRKAELGAANVVPDQATGLREKIPGADPRGVGGDAHAVLALGESGLGLVALGKEIAHLPLAIAGAEGGFHHRDQGGGAEGALQQGDEGGRGQPVDDRRAVAPLLTGPGEQENGQIRPRLLGAECRQEILHRRAGERLLGQQDGAGGGAERGGQFLQPVADPAGVPGPAQDLGSELRIATSGGRNEHGAWGMFTHCVRKSSTWGHHEIPGCQ
ncbi:MAG: hypothetical protein QM796_21815 [Chthoniobacteraceae bacterium]